MPADARHHHYIPQCYLRGFTVRTGKRLQLTVARLSTWTSFETNARNVAGVRDFNRVDVDGHPPDALEAALSTFEGQAAASIRRVVATGTFSGEDRVVLLNLATLLAVRSPQQREHWRQFQEHLWRNVMSLALSSKERWLRQVQQMKQAGRAVNEAVTYEQVKEFNDRGEYTVQLATCHHIGVEFGGFEAVLPFMLARRWALYRTDKQKGFFLTTDRPVLLTWNRPADAQAARRNGPGYGMHDTEVLFPLTRDALLIGEFDGPEGTFPANFELVAAANTKMFVHAFDQAYLPGRSLSYRGPDGRFHHDTKLVERFRAVARG